MKKTSEQIVIVGVDFGSWTFKIGAFCNGNFEVLTNQANFRETPSLVSFHDHQRLVGEEAQNKLKSNYMNTVRAPLRLIGLQKNFQLIEQELKYSPAKYDAGEELHFWIQMSKNIKTKIQPQQLLISLMSKVYTIVDSHNLDPEGYYLTIPSFMSHYERKLIKRCGQIVLHSTNVTLVDDWLSIASEYAFNRLNDIKKDGLRTVIFVDIGYSKCSFFVIEFTAKEPRLLDCEHMRFTGSKNMDHLITQFYDKIMKKGRNSDQSVFGSQKAVVKMLDNVEKQRKVLSANEDSHINIEELFQHYDLTYDMKRTQMEQIIQPVLSQIQKGLKNIRERMPSNYIVHSIELIGGTSRMPYFKTLIKQVFNIEPSRTLNLSQSTVRGTTVYGAVTSKILPLSYSLTNTNLIDIWICWNPTGINDCFFGQNQNQYRNRQIIFRANSPIPSQFAFNFGNQGPIEVYIYYGQTVTTKSIGYMRFMTPNRIRFSLDQSKIVSASLDWGKFDLCKMQDKKQARWEFISKWQQNLRVLEQRIKIIYELKNEFESKLYQLRGKLTEFKQIMSTNQYDQFKNRFQELQKWIQHQNNRPLSTPDDLLLYEDELKRLKEYESAVEMMRKRKAESQSLRLRYENIISVLKSIPAEKVNEKQKRKLQFLYQWLKDSFDKMQDSGWEGYYLNAGSLTFAEEQITRITTG